MSSRELDQEEKDVLDTFDNESYESVLTDERKKFLGEVAKDTFKKNKRINIRLSGRDLDALQRRALREGVPYQTLVSSILHKYVSGNFKEGAARNSTGRIAKKVKAKASVRKKRA